MLNNPPLKNRLFFRGGRASIFPLALIALFLMTFVITAYSLSFAENKKSKHSPQSVFGADDYSTPKDDDKSKSDNRQTVEPRPETQAREGVTAREPVKRP